jgi:hypothetical protein
VYGSAARTVAWQTPQVGAQQGVLMVSIDWKYSDGGVTNVSIPTGDLNLSMLSSQSAIGVYFATEFTSNFSSNSGPDFLAHSGTINISEASPSASGRFHATLTNVRLEEWDRSHGFVDGGCVSIPSLDINVSY